MQLLQLISVLKFSSGISGPAIEWSFCVGKFLWSRGVNIMRKKTRDTTMADSAVDSFKWTDERYLYSDLHQEHHWKRNYRYLRNDSSFEGKSK